MPLVDPIMKRTYEVLHICYIRDPLANRLQNALRLLGSRRRRARPKDIGVVATVNDNVDSPNPQNLKGVPSLVGMREWLEILGHSVPNISYPC